MNYDAVIFDLDGTLLDTLADLAAAGNYALEQVGRPTYALKNYRTLVGQGVHQLFVDALGPEHQDKVDDAIASFKDYYREHRFDTTRPYGGIETMLQNLDTAGIALGVLSNKPHEATADVVNRFFGKSNWRVVRGHKPGTDPKPDPTGAREVIQALSILPQRCAYVGDTRVDMLTGKAAGMFTVGVSWGFREVDELWEHGADAIVDSADELVNLILKQA